MEAKDGSMGFDFEGQDDDIKIHEFIAYTLEDGREIKNTFTQNERQMAKSSF